MITESQLILTAMSKGSPKKRQRLTMSEIEPDPVLADANTDPIMKLAKKMARRQPKQKTISQWNNSDFIRHVGKMCQQFGIEFDTGESIRDFRWVQRLHDMLLQFYGDDMSNLVLREYIDWWIPVHGRFQRDGISVRTMMKDYHIDQFVKQYRKGKPQLPIAVRIENSEDRPQVETSDDDLYDMGGIAMLVMSKGLVVAHRLLVRRSVANPLMQLSNAMRGLAKEVVEQVVKITMDGAPYSKSDIVDFMSVARPAMKYHGITCFSKVNYKEFFKEN